MSTRPDVPLIGLVLGDWTGIGPELCARLLHERRLADVARLLAIGDARVLARGARDAGVPLAVRPVSGPEAAGGPDADAAILDLGNLDPERIPRGAVSPESGRIVGETLQRAVELALAGRLDGITFAPLSKAALHAGGWRFADEHQLFAHLCGHTGSFGEMNLLDDLWVARVTSHVSLRTALDQITPERIARALALADGTMRAVGIARPRIAVCALNPHAGESGRFGREELDVIAPAVARAAASGIACTGPYPADTVFRRALAGEFDGVLAMFHDQGQIATKLAGFDRGVTVTAGLETVFTTPAHGTAFDIVGQGKANAGALEQAVRLAARLARNRKIQPRSAPHGSD
jgi:4-hydroxythreonine-4-phosphate dehydrogenase